MNKVIDVWHHIIEYLGPKDVMAVRACNRTFYLRLPMNIRLKSYQIGHIIRLEEILQRSYAYMDTSPKGAGKTFHAMFLAKRYNLALMVVCQVNMIPKWERLTKLYQVPLLEVISYQSLRGTSTSQPKHRWLQRSSHGFSVTQEFGDAVEEGVLLIFDEVQNMRNDSQQFDAGYELASYIFTSNSSSRVGLVSWTPCSSNEGAENMIKLLGLIKEPKLVEYDRPNRTWIPRGLYEVYEHAYEVDPVKANEIYQFQGRSKKEAYEICYKLYTNVLIKSLASATPEFPLEVKKTVRNAFYPVSEAELETLELLIDKLAEVSHYDPVTQTTEYTQQTHGLLWKLLPQIEKQKASTFIRAAREVLDKNPKAKVVIFLNYLEAIDLVRNGLQNYKPLVISGSVDRNLRDQYMQKFQAASAEYRVLITNPQTSGSGVDLDDIHGDFPRHAFISPSYNFINLDQATGRVYRANTRSDVCINLVYIEGLEQEQRILFSIQTKSEKARGMLYNSENVQFPGEYPIERM